jgi:multidrug efflux system outer membrane protein
VRSLTDSAAAQVLASEESRRVVQISLIASVANQYLALAADEELLDLTLRTLDTREQSLKLTQLRFDNGAASELDLRQAQTLAEAARVTLAQQRRQRELDRNALALLLGQALPEWPAVPARVSAIALADVPAGVPSEVLLRRPDVAQAEQQLVAANASIGAARAAFWPRITLTASAGTASTQLSDLFKDGAWSFAAQLLQPIFDAGRNRANLAVAEVQRDIAVAQYERAIQAAFRDVADALAGRATLDDQVRATQAQADAEQARYRLSELRFRNGVSSSLELLDAERSLFAVQQAVVQTQLAFLQNRVSAYRALGGGNLGAAGQ